MIAGTGTRMRTGSTRSGAGVSDAGDIVITGRRIAVTRLGTMQQRPRVFMVIRSALGSLAE
jgi:hypothetical protein